MSHDYIIAAFGDFSPLRGNGISYPHIYACETKERMINRLVNLMADDIERQSLYEWLNYNNETIEEGYDPGNDKLYEELSPSVRRYVDAKMRGEHIEPVFFNDVVRYRYPINLKDIYCVPEYVDFIKQKERIQYKWQTFLLDTMTGENPDVDEVFKGQIVHTKIFKVQKTKRC